MQSSTGDGVVILLTVDEAARALRLGRSRMYELLRAGEVSSVKIGSARRVAVSELEAYAARLQTEGSTGTVA